MFEKMKLAVENFFPLVVVYTTEYDGYDDFLATQCVARKYSLKYFLTIRSIRNDGRSFLEEWLEWELEEGRVYGVMMHRIMR